MSNSREILEKFMSQHRQVEEEPSFSVFDAKPVTLGASFTDRVEPTVREMTALEIENAYIELSKQNPAILERLAIAHNFAKPFAQPKRISPFPFHKASSIELSLSDKTPKQSTAKKARVRPDREAMRFSGRINVCTGTNMTVSNPDWAGTVEFRSASRAVKDAQKACREGNFKQPFVDWMTELAAGVDDDVLFGFMRFDAREHGGGKPHVDNVLLVSRHSEMETYNPSVIILTCDNAGLSKMALPGFSTRTSKNNPLGTFAMQCRATREMRDWSTGLFEITK